MTIKENRENLESIVRTVRRSTTSNKFALIFAVCNSLGEQEKYVEKLRQRCRKDDIILTEVKLLDRLPIKNLLPVIKGHMSKKFNNGLPGKLGIQVTGLELSILLDPDEQSPKVLQVLNMNRERYYKQLPFPIIFWLPEYACTKLANIAPDFWSFRVVTATFCSGETQQSLLSENLEDGQNITLWQDKIAQIPVLERLLATHQSTEVLVDLLIKSGEAYYYIGKTERARQRYEQAIKENENVNGDPQRVAEAYSRLGIIYSDLGFDDESLRKAVNSLQRYLKIVGQADKTDLIAVGYNHLGLVYDKHTTYDQALQSYEEALKISRRHGHRKLEGDVLGNMGLLYRKQKKYEDALTMHEEALLISREMNDLQSTALDLRNIGLIHYEQEKYQEAIDYYTQAMLSIMKTGNKQEEMNQ